MLVCASVEAALEIELCADKIATVGGRIFALRLHLDMLANKIVGFESVATGMLPLIEGLLSASVFLFHSHVRLTRSHPPPTLYAQ